MFLDFLPKRRFNNRKIPSFLLQTFKNKNPNSNGDIKEKNRSENEEKKRIPVNLCEFTNFYDYVRQNSVDLAPSVERKENIIIVERNIINLTSFNQR